MKETIFEEANYIPFFSHISNPDNKERILKEGIKGNDEGIIFLFADVILKSFRFKKFRVADHIARNQIFSDKYCLFKIDSKGINSNVFNDNVAEFTAKYQFYIKQNLIKPEHIQFIETRDISNKREIVKFIDYQSKLRRELFKIGYSLKKSRVKKPHFDNMGGYMICDIETGEVVAGRRLELSLEDVEEFLKDE